jgi:cytochrome P450
VSAKRPPGPKGLPLVGSLVDYARDPLGFLSRLARDHGDVVWVRIPKVSAVMLSHPRDIEQVLRGSGRGFIKDLFTRAGAPIAGKGLLLSEGELWRRQRRLMAPLFAHHQIQRYAEVMVERAEALAARLARGGGARDIHQDIMHLTLEIVARCLFGIEVGAEAATISSSVEAVMDYFLSPLSLLPGLDRLPLPRSRRLREAVRGLDEVVYRIIRERREQEAPPGDLLSTLLAARDEDGSRMSDAQLRDEVLTLYLAGHETTALALSYALYLLAGSSADEAALYEEVASFGARPFAAEDMAKLPFTQAVVKEAMRLYPPAWAIGREALQDIEVGGYLLPKGTQITLAQWVVHRDPRFYEEPERFLPSRWLSGLSERLPRGAYFPFGDGLRICIGNHFAMMEATLILATLIRRLRFRSTRRAPLELLPSITLRPKGGIPMVVTRR